ncbi:MAG: hypothetical protein VST68_06280, partial [Nitrospirota bacterium]|nr:hypothetical protein [Nitrospirota bacterium]
DCSKRPFSHPPNPGVPTPPFRGQGPKPQGGRGIHGGTLKALRAANGAKSAKSVSPKVENAAGGLFQQAPKKM